MLNNAIGLILADNRRIQLGELMRPRALAAIPFGGRYRIIDFSLSNLVNSGIIQVGVIALHKYKSLMDHLGTGSSWDLDRKRPGLNIIPPYINSTSQNPHGDPGDLTGLLDFFIANRQKYVVIFDSQAIFNATLNDFLETHEASGADMSILYNRDGLKHGVPNITLTMDRRGQVRDVLFDLARSTNNRSSIGVAILEREWLIERISQQIARGENEFSLELLLREHASMRIQGIEFHRTILRVNSIRSYFSSTMALLDEEIRRDLFWSGLPVYTKVKDEAPALYEEGNLVSDSVISDGCLIQGQVHSSMLFRGVTISAHSVVRNCIIMQDTFISEGVELDHVILDKNCVIRPGIKLVGQPGYPMVIGKGAVV